MFYEESVIDGVLHWRGAPDGQWTAKTAQQLTEMLMEARRSRHATTVHPVYVAPPTPQPLWVTPGNDPLGPPFKVTC